MRAAAGLLRLFGHMVYGIWHVAYAVMRGSRSDVEMGVLWTVVVDGSGWLKPMKY